MRRQSFNIISAGRYYIKRAAKSFGLAALISLGALACGGGAAPGRESEPDAAVETDTPETDAYAEAYDGGFEKFDGAKEDKDGGSGDGCVSTAFFMDYDNDRFGNSSKSKKSCEKPHLYVSVGGDCDDDNSDIFPGAREKCDGYINDCGRPEAIDGSDEEPPLNSRTAGVCAGSLQSCRDGSWQDDYSEREEFEEIEATCDGLDNDCDGEIDNGLWPPRLQSCSRGEGDCRSFGQEHQICLGEEGWSVDYHNCDAVPSSPSDETCDGRDNNCDGMIDNNLTDLPLPRGCSSGIGECERSGLEYRVCLGAERWSSGYDSGCDAVPGAPSAEICDGLDNNCNGEADEGLFFEQYQDADFDSFGNGEDSLIDCLLREGYVRNSDDCDDEYGSVNPAAGELMDLVDNDCDSNIDLWLQVDAQEEVTCGRRIDDTLVCWGDNDFGQQEVPSGTFRQVSVGGRYVCGLRTDNSISCWGYDYRGDPRNILDPPPGRFTMIATGQAHACAIKDDNSVACWGVRGFSGDDDTYRNDSPPGTFLQVDCGGYHTCAIKSDNSLQCWGSNGDRQTEEPPGRYRLLSAGHGTNCVLDMGNRLSCWGRGTFGEDIRVPPSGEFINLSMGAYHGCAVRRTDSAIECWGGENSYGERNVPEGEFTQVSVGTSHSCGLRTDSTIICWGSNSAGQLTIPSREPEE